jgi:hypothetical protein
LLARLGQVTVQRPGARLLWLRCLYRRCTRLGLGILAPFWEEAMEVPEFG